MRDFMLWYKVIAFWLLLHDMKMKEAILTLCGEPFVHFLAIPFEKVVGGVSDVGFPDHPAAIFAFFSGYPAAISE